MKSFKQYLKEARRNPHLNPRIDPVDAIAMYANDPRKFVTFTDIKKVGINPKSHYNTPIGIYSYPIARVHERAQKKNTLFNSMPYAADKENATVFKQTGTILDISNPSMSLARDLKDAADDYARDKGLDDSTLRVSMLKAKEDSDKGGDSKEVQTIARLWFYTHNIAKKISVERGGSTPVIWNKIFREAKIDAVVDPGYGIIHRAEPYQAVHFHRRSIDVVTMLENKENRLRAGKRAAAMNNTETPTEVLYPTFKNIRTTYEAVKMTFEFVMENSKMVMPDEENTWMYLIEYLGGKEDGEELKLDELGIPHGTLGDFSNPDVPLGIASFIKERFKTSSTQDKEMLMHNMGSVFRPLAQKDADALFSQSSDIMNQIKMQGSEDYVDMFFNSYKNNSPLVPVWPFMFATNSSIRAVDNFKLDILMEVDNREDYVSEELVEKALNVTNAENLSTYENYEQVKDAMWDYMWQAMAPDAA